MTLHRLALAAAAGLALALPAAADPVFGTWQTEPGDDGAFGHVEIAACGAKVCGVLAKGFDASGKPASSPNIGRQMIWDMEAQGAGAYGNGRIWAPDRDKVYRSKMALEGNRLKVSGCVGPVCRSQTWRRVD
jgi:uncharacterized protein (DUF2147 family)